MSKLKISENLFLEVAELNRLVKFISDDGYKKVLKSIIKNYGIVENENNTYFKLSAVSTGVIKVNAGIAFNSNLDAIVMSEDQNLNISDSGLNRWIILSRATSHLEEGTVNITADGSLIGVGTKFTEILRGQPNFPTKIKLASSNNVEEYEVVSVISDTNAVLSGNFTVENNLKYSVIGTFTPGFQALSENKEIYEYDSYNLSIVDSLDKPSVSADEYILGYVHYENGVMYVNDERVYCMFNQVYNQDSEVTGISPLTSLLSATVVGGVDAVRAKAADIELILEHGYKVTAYELNNTSQHNVFQITIGSSNFFGTRNILDNTFNGWLLLNRVNMKYAKIDYNIGKNLYISNFDSEIVSNDANDFVIVPNFSEIEYEVSLSGNVTSPQIPFYFRNSIGNLFSRVRIYSIFPSFGGSDSVTISMRYRFIDESGKKYPFQKLSTAPFININGDSETLANSSFSIDMRSIEPEAEQRNYS